MIFDSKVSVKFLLSLTLFLMWLLLFNDKNLPPSVVFFLFTINFFFSGFLNSLQRQGVIIKIFVLCTFLPFLPMVIYFDPHYFEEDHKRVFGLLSNPLLLDPKIVSSVIVIGGIALNVFHLAIITLGSRVVLRENFTNSNDLSAKKKFLVLL